MWSLHRVRVPEDEVRQGARCGRKTVNRIFSLSIRGVNATARFPDEVLMTAPFVSSWTLEEGLVVVRELEAQCSRYGWHFALGGGVLLRGQSDHDLDVIVYPHSSRVGVDTGKLRARLRDLGWKLRGRAEYVIEEWRKKGSIDRKHVDIWATPDGKRVDVIVPTVTL